MLLDYVDYLDAWEADVEACQDALEGGLTAIWEPDDHSWRVTYTIGDREVVYRWFERLEDDPLEVVEGCQTLTRDWEYQEWKKAE